MASPPAGQCCSAGLPDPRLRRGRLGLPLQGEVRYARDAFEGLRLMDAVASAKRDPKTSLADALPALRKRRVSRGSKVAEPARSRRTLRRGHRQPGADAAVLGQPRRSRPASRRLCGLPRRAGDVSRPVGAARDPRWPDVRGSGRGGGPAPAADVAGPSAHRGILEAAVVYGYWPAVSDGNDLAVSPLTITRRRLRGSGFHGSAATGGSAWPTSSGPVSRANSTWWRSTW